MPPISSLVLSLGAIRKRDWMVRDVMKKIVWGSKCRTGYAMATASEQFQRQAPVPVAYLQPARRRVSSRESYCGTPVRDRYAQESCESCLEGLRVFRNR